MLSHTCHRIRCTIALHKKYFPSPHFTPTLIVDAWPPSSPRADAHAHISALLIASLAFLVSNRRSQAPAAIGVQLRASCLRNEQRREGAHDEDDPDIRVLCKLPRHRFMPSENAKRVRVPSGSVSVALICICSLVRPASVSWPDFEPPGRQLGPSLYLATWKSLILSCHQSNPSLRIQRENTDTIVHTLSSSRPPSSTRLTVALRKSSPLLVLWSIGICRCACSTECAYPHVALISTCPAACDNGAETARHPTGPCVYLFLPQLGNGPPVMHE